MSRQSKTPAARGGLDVRLGGSFSELSGCFDAQQSDIVAGCPGFAAVVCLLPMDFVSGQQSVGTTACPVGKSYSVAVMDFSLSVGASKK